MKVTTKQAYTSPKLELQSNYLNIVMQSSASQSNTSFQLPSGF